MRKSPPYEQMLLLDVMFNRYFNKRIQHISVKKSLPNYDVVNDVYNDFIKCNFLQSFVSLDDSFVYNSCHIGTRHNLYKLIQQNKIKGVWCINKYLTNLKRQKRSEMIDNLYGMVCDFIGADGAVIIGNKHFHQYMNTRPVGLWCMRLYDRFY